MESPGLAPVVGVIAPLVLRANYDLACTLMVVALIALAIPFGVQDWLFWRRVRRLLNSGPWTSVPITLPNLVESFDVAHGHATLSDGRTIPVRVRTSYSLAANIAATGLIWVAGEPAAGREMAVGLPGYSVLGHAHFGS